MIWKRPATRPTPARPQCAHGVSGAPAPLRPPTARAIDRGERGRGVAVLDARRRARRRQAGDLRRAGRGSSSPAARPACQLNSALGDHGAGRRAARWPRRRCAGICGVPSTAGRPARKMPAFSRADGLERVAEPVAVVEADRAQHRDIRIDEVDRIEPPAQAHLQHRHVDLLLGKQQQRRQRVVLEERQRGRAARRLDALEHARPAAASVASRPPIRMRSL